MIELGWHIRNRGWAPKIEPTSIQTKNKNNETLLKAYRKSHAELPNKDQEARGEVGGKGGIPRRPKVSQRTSPLRRQSQPGALPVQSKAKQ